MVLATWLVHASDMYCDSGMPVQRPAHHPGQTERAEAGASDSVEHRFRVRTIPLLYIVGHRANSLARSAGTPWSSC